MSCHRLLASASLVAVLLLLGGPVLAQDKSWTKVPANVSELRDLEKRVIEIAKKVKPAVVAVQVGSVSGSGVIVKEEGYVLTAGHISGQPGRDVIVILADGQRVLGKTLGANRGLDSGMIKITEGGKWPFTPMGDSTKVEKGQWCLAYGHPGGYQTERGAVLRLGRILNSTQTFVQTDCAIVQGDDGGPLFDLDGKVVGIHSRIGVSISFNIHVPVAAYVDDWDRLVKGETFGSVLGLESRSAAVPSTGLSFMKVGDLLKVVGVEKDSPAERAGIKPRDILVGVERQKVADRDELDAILRKKKPGEEVVVELLRAGESLILKLVLGKAR